MVDNSFKSYSSQIVYRVSVFVGWHTNKRTYTRPTCKPIGIVVFPGIFSTVCWLFNEQNVSCLDKYMCVFFVWLLLFYRFSADFSIYMTVMTGCCFGICHAISLYAMFLFLLYGSWMVVMVEVWCRLLLLLHFFCCCCCCISCLTALSRSVDTLMMNMKNNVKHHKWLYGHTYKHDNVPNIESQHDFNWICN